MGIAGGLVPSPSALVVLLSAIALGRTTFGVVLVFAYGLGMAATLTVAGLLLVRVRDRLQRRASARVALGSIGQRWLRVSPYATASLVVSVGLGLAVRSVTAL
jgi:nickel/cobalt transporter (NicO) family protein